MKTRYLSIISFFGGLLMLFLTGGITVISGCQKARLFTHIDSIPAVPARFHYFNTFSYDSSLRFSVDGLARETVKAYTFSNYYPSSSAFNLNEGQPNSKLLAIADPDNPALFNGLSTFQFKPETSYIVFNTYSVYDSVRTPIKGIIPQLVYYPEETYHPFDGKTLVRLFNCIPGNGNVSMTITPDAGIGTSLSVSPVYIAQQPDLATSSYKTTSAGMKTVVVKMTYNNITTQFNYQPAGLDNKKAYSFFAVGDVMNYLARLQPNPRLFVVADDDHSSLRELKLSSITYPGNQSTLAQVTVVNGAYNLPGLLSKGDPATGPLVQNLGVDLRLNQTAINVIRWPLRNTPSGYYEDINNVVDPLSGTSLIPRVKTNSSIQPGSYRVNVLPGTAFSPSYNAFNYDIQQGFSYTFCLIPDNTSDSKCGTLALQNDNAPDPSLFRLRVINLLGGSTQVDIHSGSPSGPIIASAVTFAQQTEYIGLPANPASQELWVTAAGSTDTLFQTGTKNRPMLLPFKGGNSGTIYLTGLLAGTPYNGDPGSYPPYAYYVSDAYINPNIIVNNTQLFY